MNEGDKLDRRQAAGWAAVGLSTVITCLWAFWGVIENFHEGWYSDSLLSNLGMMFVQYLSPMLIFLGLSLVSIYRPRIGAGLHVVFALLVAGFFRALTHTVTFFLILPLVGLAVLYWMSRLPPRRIAVSLAAGLPILTLVLFGIEPVIRVSQRLDDGNLGARAVSGNGVTLLWASDGPGWPRAGGTWEEAVQACRHLAEGGQTLADEPQDIWRLPTIDEAVRSMARHGQNSGGVWDADAAKATYETIPDKESPLWNVHSQVIYWWTATEIDQEEAYSITYNGRVWPRAKYFGPDYLGFRCVR